MSNSNSNSHSNSNSNKNSSSNQGATSTQITGVVMSVSDDMTHGTMVPSDGYSNKPEEFENHGAHVKVHKGEEHIFIAIDNHGRDDVAKKGPIIKIVTPGAGDGAGNPFS